MSWDGAVSRDHGDGQAAITHCARKARILEVRALVLVPSRRAAIPERAIFAEPSTTESFSLGRNAGCSLEVTAFAEEAACSHDEETGAETPYETAQDRDDLVSEQLFRFGARVR